MSHRSTSSHGAMEGDGSYNRHARLPADGGALALPLLKSAAQNIALDSGDRPVVIADYGSSQGRNSLAPVQVAIQALRSRLGPGRPIFVFHVDLPANDFNTLFEVLDTHPDRYGLDDSNIFPCAVGRSFYENVLPPAHVDLGWSSYAAVWLSRIPAPIPDHFVALRSTSAVRAAFDSQAAQDWEAFLSLRARELRPEGRLVVTLPALDDNGLSGFEEFMDHAHEALRAMVDDGAILAGERERMTRGAYPRRRCHLLAPFERDGRFRDLIVEYCELSVLPDAAWADYERDGNNEALAHKHARFFRATFIPSLALALTEWSDAGKRLAFADRFEKMLTRRLTSQPAPVHSFVQTIVLAKQSVPITGNLQGELSQ
jgi:hypothetical protein